MCTDGGNHSSSGDPFARLSSCFVKKTYFVFLFTDKADPFDKEKQTIEALLSQWTEEEIPESELPPKPKPDLPCFNSTVIEETNPIFQPVTAIPVPVQTIPQDEAAVIVELGAQKPMTVSDQTQLVTIPPSEGSEPMSNDVVMSEDGHVRNHGDLTKSGQFLPVEGGYIFVDDNAVPGKN